MGTIRAVVVYPEAPGRLAIEEVEEPVAGRSEALVQVEATSLNRGEVQLAGQADAGWRPGRDLAGTVVQQAPDGSGPTVGTRVVGMRDAPGVWAERIAVASDSIAPLPDEVTFAQAATLPVAGLTALFALRRGGLLLGRRVLITGSTGGVGLFASQLARRSGASVTGSVRHETDVAKVREAGADHVVVGVDLAPARDHGPFDLVLESLGGDAFATAVTLLAPDGMLVDIGWSASATSTVDVMAFNRIGGATLYGLRLDVELRGKSRAADLALLAGLVADGGLRTPIEVEAPWTRIGEVADGLLQRRFNGKAVIRLRDE